MSLVKAESISLLAARAAVFGGYKACVDNRPLRFGAGLRNTDGGVFFDVPSLTFNDGPLDFPANGPVTISPKAGGFRNHVFNYTLGMSLFPYLPGT